MVVCAPLLAVTTDAIRLVIADPRQMSMGHELAFLCQRPVIWCFAGFGRLPHCLARHLQLMRTQGILKDAADPSASADPPAVRLVDGLIADALQRRVSDIHLEPFHGGMRIRFRKDGMLHVLAAMPAELAGRVIARIKVMARLDVSEKRQPQDGRMLWESTEGHRVDLRVSTCPALGGECVVLRLHDTGAEVPGLTQLGMNEHQYLLLRQALSSPYGLILVTGPTGSGKTVSLYAALEALNHDAVNICTIEDPIERCLPGINQVAVNSRLDLGFSQLLRTFLRQDPDIIMVGEIRDPETAEMAFRAAHTGHLVLSTLHANSAVLSFARLQQLGIPAYSLVSTLCLVVAQRLVRKLCIHCRAPDEQVDPALFRAVGCHRCSGGYEGRTGIYEVLRPSEAFQALVMQGEACSVLAGQALRDGCDSLMLSGRALVRSGVTSVAELERVLAE